MPGPKGPRGKNGPGTIHHWGNFAMTKIPRLVLTEPEKVSISFIFAGCILLVFLRLTAIGCWREALRRGLYTHSGFAIPVTRVVIGGQQESAVVASDSDVQFLNFLLDTTRRRFGPGPESTSMLHSFKAQLATGQRVQLSFIAGWRPDTVTFWEDRDFAFSFPRYRRRVPVQRPKGFNALWRFLEFPENGAKFVWQ